MERVLNKINPALLEQLKKSSVLLNSESRRQLSPELLKKVSGGLTFSMEDTCRYCGGELYVWQSDVPGDYSEGWFCGSCGAVYYSFGNFDVNNAIQTVN